MTTILHEPAACVNPCDGDLLPETKLVDSWREANKAVDQARASLLSIARWTTTVERDVALDAAANHLTTCLAVASSLAAEIASYHVGTAAPTSAADLLRVVGVDSYEDTSADGSPRLVMHRHHEGRVSMRREVRP